MSVIKEIYQTIPAPIRYKGSIISNQLMRGKSPDMFTTIDVVFDDWCNRRCSYCPVSSNADRHGPIGDIMPQTYWERLLDGLQAINFSWDQGTLVINPKGDVVTCIQDHNAEGVWGNIGQEDIMDIWNKREFCEFRENRRLNRQEGMLSICHACLGK